MNTTSIKNKIIGNKFLGIEVFSNENVEKINCVLVKKNNDELLVIDYFKFESNTDILFKEESNLPVVLVVNTDKVLVKEIEVVEKNDIILVKKAFPNLNLDDFYFDIWRFSSKSIISIVRKNYLEECIEKVKVNSNLKIVAVYFGIATLKNTSDFILEENILVNGKIFNKTNKSILPNTSLQIQNIYGISGMKIKGEDLLSFSAVVSFVQSDFGTGSILELNTNIKEAFLQQSIFKKLTRITVFSLLIVLLINYIFFTYYFNKYEKLSLENEQEIVNQSKLEVLKRSVLEKEKKLREIDLSSAQKVAQKVNTISKSIPNTILLEEFQFQPIQKKGSDNTIALFKENKIEIKGITTNNDDFTHWIEILSHESFIKEVVIIDFGKNENKDLFFNISITLDEAK